MATYRIDLEYLGTAYRGWQAQKNAETVANRLEAACRAVFGQVGELQAAGRTDSGVHALHQVAHLRAPAVPERPPLALRINDRLPGDIAVRSVRRVEDSFHARHAAVERVYLYQVLRRRSAFGANQAFWVRDRLDAAALRAAAAALCGAHDFAAFCEADPQRPETRCDIRSIEVAEDGAMLLLRFRARHFLWKMVRRMTGAMLEVARGKAAPQDLTRSLANPDGRWAPFTAPPQGLYLERVLYPGDRLDDPLRAVLSIPR